jgi:hypothetical protein
MGLDSFEPWSGAVTNFKKFTPEQLDDLEQHLCEIYPDGMDETTVNDLFWFEPEWLAGLLGLHIDPRTDDYLTDDEAEERADDWAEGLHADTLIDLTGADDWAEAWDDWQSYDLDNKLYHYFNR